MERRKDKREWERMDKKSCEEKGDYYDMHIWDTGSGWMDVQTKGGNEEGEGRERQGRGSGTEGTGGSCMHLRVVSDGLGSHEGR